MASGKKRKSPFEFDEDGHPLKRQKLMLQTKCDIGYAVTGLGHFVEYCEANQWYTIFIPVLVRA